MSKTLILQLGSNNWQRGGEFAPGSGILHESHHRMLNGFENTHCYSIYPSKVQTSDDPKVRIFEIDHDIPICESISPVSSYRFHGMSEAQFEAYRERLRDFVEQYIVDIEAEHGQSPDLMVAHHTFLNSLVMQDVNRRRVAAGKDKIKLLCFVHGTALKMFVKEKEGKEPEEYPNRFLPMMQAAGVFDAANEFAVDYCAAISQQQLDAFKNIYGDYDDSRMALSPNGYNNDAFKPHVYSLEERNAVLEKQALQPSNSGNAPSAINTDGVEKVVVFCGKFADWKRLDALLRAAAIVEKEQPGVMTLIMGTGPQEAIDEYHALAYDTLGLKNTYFLGPRGQAEIAELNSLAAVGCYPARNEPFGLVFIECMACGTPVIGADSGGPRDFVSEDVGELVPETDDIDALAVSLADAISRALAENWKLKRGPAAASFALNNYSVEKQCRDLLTAVGL
jgi:glycosyltransferase involved in cell wall biosynthesis